MIKPSDTRRILIVEDELHIAEGLKLNLSLQGYDVKIADDGGAALHLWKEWKPDLIVLDIMLPVINGLSVLQSIRLEDERLPVLILSAKGAPEDRVKGLMLGGDDYICKPFELDEFLLRVNRLLARTSWAKENQPSQKKLLPERYYTFGTNQIDFETFIARGRAGDIQLTELEIRLLKLFITHKGKPLSRSRILEIGWGYSKETETRTVDNFIVRFRKYFEENPRKPKYFKSLRSVGYMFDPDGA